MIVDLERFIQSEQPVWARLEEILKLRANDPSRTFTMEEALDLERLYQRACSDLARVSTYEAAARTRRYLESLVARAYAEVHGGRGERARFRPWRWFSKVFPQTFRRQWKPFALSLALTIAGTLFGIAVGAMDPKAKADIVPFSHLMQSPTERVAREMEDQGKHIRHHEASFSSELMTHNIKVTLTVLGLGFTWGIGTIAELFYNGVILGVICLDYVSDGQGVFLAGWLLPHGVIEIPAVMIGGQAGFLLASALIGRGSSQTLRERLAASRADLVTLAGGASCLLVWAGIVEAFFSQYHEPVIPYAVKITFGLLELAGLTWFLLRAGRPRAKA